MGRNICSLTSSPIQGSERPAQNQLTFCDPMTYGLRQREAPHILQSNVVGVVPFGRQFISIALATAQAGSGGQQLRALQQADVRGRTGRCSQPLLLMPPHLCDIIPKFATRVD